MKSFKVFIKSNFIKRAKDDWIYCNAELLTHDKLSILKLISLNNGNNSYEFGMLNRSNSTSNELKLLVNLSDFKSPEIKAVSFKNSEKFAVKLTSCSILQNKRIVLLPEDESDLTKICGLLTEYMHKSKENELFGNNRAVELINRTLKPKIKEHQIILNRTETDNSRFRTSPTKINSLPVQKNDDVYFSLDDNDVYDQNSSDNDFTVCVEESSDSKKIGLRGTFILRLKNEGLELTNIKTGEMVHVFPYIFIRRFGAKNDILRLEAGRKCSTGEGYLIFRFKDAQRAAEIIRELVMELKKTESIAKKNDRDNVKSDDVDGFIKPSVIQSSTTHNTSIASNHSNSVDEPDDNMKSRFLSSGKTTKSPSPTVTLKPRVTMLSQVPNTNIIRETDHPIHDSVSSMDVGRTSPTKSHVSNITRRPSSNRPSIMNNNFSRNNHVAASFSYGHPARVTGPVNKASQDDSNCKNGRLLRHYDNPTIRDRGVGSSNYVINNKSQNAGVTYSTSYSMPKPLVSRNTGNYDNVPSNQRCIQELESMLTDLGVSSR